MNKLALQLVKEDYVDNLHDYLSLRQVLGSQGIHIIFTDDCNLGIRTVYINGVLTFGVDLLGDTSVKMIL